MSCKNVQILNFNHNIVEVGLDNKIVITDQIKCNSITIPQPVTNILQINSPGPQGPVGPAGSGGGVSGDYVTTASFNAFTASYNTFSSSYNTGSFSGSFTGSFNGTASWAYSASNAINSLTASYINPLRQNVIITGSLTVSGSSTFTNIGPAIFSGSVSSNSGFTGSFSGNGSQLTNLPSQVEGNGGEIQFNAGGGFGGVTTLTYNSGTGLVTATNIKATGVFAEYVTTTTIGNTIPATFDVSTDLTITQSGTYIVTIFSTEDPGYIYFPDPTTRTGEKIRIQNRDSINTADIGVGDYGRPRDINDSQITSISTQTTKLFISNGTDWLEI